MSVAPGDLIAVTGGTGAIGRRLIRDLLDEGFRVRLLSRSAPPDLAIEHVPVDLSSDGPLTADALAECSAMLHLAAYIPSNHEDPASAVLCFQTNVLGTLKLLQAMEEAGIKRLLQTTSANAYAPGIEAPSEQQPMYPMGRAPFYLSSKLVQDIFGSHWALCRGMSVTTLRLGSVYGAGMKDALFTRFARALREGDAIRLANGGSFGADFVEISDVARAATMFLRSGVAGAFNVASGERTTLLEAAELLLDLTGSSPDKLIVEAEERLEIGFPQMDITKVRQLGFVPTDFRTGLARLVGWLGEHGFEREP
jgi:UDP-glucose 4-epimerase